VTVLAIVIGILILLPLVVWVQRLQDRGVITDERPLDRLIRQRITGKPAPLTPPEFSQSRMRYYRTVLLTVPGSTSGVTVLIAAIAKSHNPLGLVIAAAVISGVLGLAISEDRFKGVSRRQRITCASLSGLITVIATALIIAGVDPHATFASVSG
jgi:hypothetical protein